MMAVCLLPLLLANVAAAADTSSMMPDNNIASKSSVVAHPIPIVSSETNLMLRRRLADATAPANDKKRETDKTGTKKTSTADLVAKAKEDAKKKVDDALQTAVSDKKDDAKKESADKKKKADDKPKVPQFSVHKKPISSASLTKVADSVAKAAALEKKKEMEKDSDEKKKDGEDAKVLADKKTSTVTKATADGKTKDIKAAESTHAAVEAKKDIKPTTKADDDEKKPENKKEPFSDVGKKPTSSFPVTSDAKTSTTPIASDNADNVKKEERISSMAKPQLPKPVKPNSIKDVDKCKEKLKQTRADLLKKNPKLQKKVDAKKAEEDKKNLKATAADNGKTGTPKAKAAVANTSAGGKDKLDEMAKQMKKKQAFAKLKDVLRKREEKQKKANNAKKDEKDPHQRRSRPLRPGERVFSKIPIVKRAYKKTPLENAFSDATLSLVEGLKHGIFTDEANPLDHRRKEALRDWLSLLSATLPPELALHMLINDLLANIDTASQKKSKLLKILKKHPIKERKWSAECSRSGKRSETGGFSCGFWKLFHIISVGLAEQRVGIDVGKTAISPMKAADTLREYMVLFFGCELCSRNFLSQYDQCAYRRCDRLSESAQDLEDVDWYEFALYLWEFHNGISVNVYNEKAGSNKAMGRDEISVIFPSMEQCFLCLKEDGTFDDEHVTRHLVEAYWSGPDGDSKDELLRSYERSLEKPMFSNSILFLSLSMMAVAAYIMKRRYIKRTGLHKKFDRPSSNGHTASKKWRRI